MRKLPWDAGVRVAAGVAVLLLIATWAWYGLQAATIETRTKTELAVRADRLANAYVTDVTAEVGFVQSVLSFVASVAATRGIHETALLVKANRLYNGVGSNIAIVDRTGAGVAVGATGIVPFNIADRPHFRAALVERGSLLTIGAPVVTKLRKTVAIPFALPVRGSDGRIVGVVSTALDSKSFVAAYDESDIGRNGVLAMIDTREKVLLSRFTITSASGGQTITPAFLKRPLAENPHGSYWRPSAPSTTCCAPSPTARCRTFRSSCSPAWPIPTRSRALPTFNEITRWLRRAWKSHHLDPAGGVASPNRVGKSAARHHDTRRSGQCRGLDGEPSQE